MNILKRYKFYPKDKIESKAYEVFKIMEAENLPPKWPFDASRAADALELMISWEGIPCDKQGLIVAKIIPVERKILLNENIPGLHGGFEQSTIAHEIGHWVLHINQDEADGLTEQMELNLNLTTAEQFFLCRSYGDKIYESGANSSKLESIEWQAQYFAGCLLMPRHILEKARKGRILTNWRHLYAIKDELGVTISNLTYRLQDLGWIYIAKDSKIIYQGQALDARQKKLF